MNKSCTIISPDESCELGVFYENGTLYAGFISNSGANKEWSIEYNQDLTFDDNVELLYDVISDSYERMG
jgi:hypothetical protein